MMALLIEITVEANTWAAYELAREPVETFLKLSKGAREVLYKRGQTRRLIPPKVWVCQSLLPRSPLGGRLKWGSKGIANVSPVRKSTQAE
jgi:hypothetical protein